MLHKIIRSFVAAIVALAILATPAHAIPRAWKSAPTFTRAGVTYRVKGRVAVVTKTTGKSVTIPSEVSYKGKHYEVKAIWAGACKGAKKITIHADLETIETPRLWQKGVRVNVTRKGMYQWLKRTGVKDLHMVKCAGCK